MKINNVPTGLLIRATFCCLLLAFAGSLLANGPDSDVNGDSNVNVVDVQLTVNIVLGSTQPATEFQGDANYDGTRNVVDVQTIVNDILSVPFSVRLGTRPLPNATPSSPYSASLFAWGGTPPYTFSGFSGQPAGLSINTLGAITGSTSANGSFQISATVTDSTSATANGQVPLTVGSGSTSPPSITTSAITTATLNQPYTYVIGVAGNPTPAVSVINRPSWLSFNSGTRTLSGTPTEAQLGYTNQMTIIASNGNLPNATQSFQIAVNSGGPTPQITSTAPTTATVNQSYSYTVIALGTPPANVTVNGLPSWLSLNNRTISGTPLSGNVGTTGTITITAANGNLPNATQSFTITVAAASQSALITSTPVTSVTQFEQYTYNITTIGSPTPTLTVGNLPHWLNLTGSQLSGIPGHADIGVTETIDLTVSNGVGQPFTQSFEITVAAVTDPFQAPELQYVFPPTDVNAGGFISNTGRVVLIFSKPLQIGPNTTVGLNNAVFNGVASTINGPYTALNGTTISFPTGVTGYENRIMVITPGASFGTNQFYLANLFPRRTTGTTGQGIFDTNGNPLFPEFSMLRFGTFNGDFAVGMVWTHTQTVDSTPPSRQSSTPSANTVAASNTPVSVTFSEPINPASLALGFQVADSLGAVSGELTIDPTTLRTINFAPSRTLQGTVSVVICGVQDLGGNGAGSGQNFNFTVGNDTTAPTITNLTINGIPDDLNGGPSSGGGSSGGGTLSVPPNGFTIDIEYNDGQGTGIAADPADFTIQANVTIGSNPANTNLAPNWPSDYWHITPTEASFLVPPTMTLPFGNVVFTARVRDQSSNLSSPVTFTVVVKNPSSSVIPFPINPDNWHFWFLRDHETTTYNFGANNVTSPNNDVVSGNSTPDFNEDLHGYGFYGHPGGNTPVASGGGLTVQDAARNWVINRIIHHTYRYYNMHLPFSDSNPNPGFASILPTSSPATPWDAPSVRITHAATTPPGNVPRIAFGGIPQVMVLGRASFDPNNTSRTEDNGVGNSVTNLGCFSLVHIFNNWNGGAPANGSIHRWLWEETLPFAGATGIPLGGSTHDAFILDPQANLNGFSTARMDRYKLVLRALDGFALEWARVCAHEIGHSMGLIKDGSPGPGLYGNSSAFPGSTSGHIVVNSMSVGNGHNIMQPSGSLSNSQSRHTRFNQLAMAYLQERSLAD